MTSRDWHGVERAYVRDDGTATALRALVRLPVRLDRLGVLAAWGEPPERPGSSTRTGLSDAYELRTVVAGVRQLGCRASQPRELSWVDAFEESVASVARCARDPVLALGGGIDAAAVLVAWRASGIAMPAVCTLATGIADYDEVADALAIAAAIGVRCEVIDVCPDALVALAPEAATAAETPLYNLHPVHRLALAREARRRGGATLVTGDGADAVFRGRPDLDYVPVVAALTRAAGLALASPFFADAVVDGTALDPTKRLARDYLRANGLGWLADRSKRPRLVPALDVSAILAVDRIERLARALDLAPALETDRMRVGWATLDHLVRHLEIP
jgi:asparagine synthase (glutamine-hydrolysing)